MPTHSPLPFKVLRLADHGWVDIRDANNKAVCFTGAQKPTEENEANAKLLVDSCNKHAALKAEPATMTIAKDEVRELLEDAVSEFLLIAGNPEFDPLHKAIARRLVERALVLGIKLPQVRNAK
jgi:hypothetical protein